MQSQIDRDFFLVEAIEISGIKSTINSPLNTFGTNVRDLTKR